MFFRHLNSHFMRSIHFFACLLPLVFGEYLKEFHGWKVAGLRTGKYVNIETYPYVVSIRYAKSRKVICTGVIVTLSWILSVPHCFMLTPEHYIREGNHRGAIPSVIEALATKRNEPTFARFSSEIRNDIHSRRTAFRYGPFKFNKTLLTSTTVFPFPEEELRKATVILEPSIFEVIAGTSSIRDCYSEGQMRAGKKIFVHPRFKHSLRKQRSPRHELALLKTDLPFVKRPSVSNTPLLENFFFDDLPSKKICQLVGWGKGKTVRPLPHLRTTLSETSLRLHRSATCRNIENSYLRAFWDDDPDPWFCAYDEKHRAIPVCQSDSGGPLVCEGQVVGLLSWLRSPTCFYNNTEYFRYLPIYFSRIYLDIRWIQDTLGASSLQMNIQREGNTPAAAGCPALTGLRPMVTMVAITWSIVGSLYKAGL